jgi:tetratricopeptide (TPR) repeat protein
MTNRSNDAVGNLADLVQRGQIEEALNRYPEQEPEIRMLQQIAHLPPQYVRSLLEKTVQANAKHQEALRLSRGGMLREAEVAFDQALQLVPEFVVAYMNRAILYAKTGRDSKAIADLQTAVRLAPRSQRAKDMLTQAQAGGSNRFKI